MGEARLTVTAMAIKSAAVYLALGVSAFAADSPQFDMTKLCAWQVANNGMNAEECAALEAEGRAYVEDQGAKADPKRVEACVAEAEAFAEDSGAASYALYASCLKNGPQPE
jgi:hypothetical protein